jgi:hypothetical protein
MANTSKAISLLSLPSLSTRESGKQVREAAIAALGGCDVLTVDFGGAEVSPSFADEFIGKLAEHLGRAEFRSRLNVCGLSEATRLLLNEVVARRFAPKAESRAALA